MSKLSPISQFVKNQGINVNPMSQKGLLKYAMNTNKEEIKLLKMTLMRSKI